jgi:hypothetical protein
MITHWQAMSGGTIKTALKISKPIMPMYEYMPLGAGCSYCTADSMPLQKNSPIAASCLSEMQCTLRLTWWLSGVHSGMQRETTDG